MLDDVQRYQLFWVLTYNCKIQERAAFERTRER